MILALFPVPVLPSFWRRSPRLQRRDVFLDIAHTAIYLLDALVLHSEAAFNRTQLTDMGPLVLDNGRRIGLSQPLDGLLHDTLSAPCGSANRQNRHRRRNNRYNGSLAQTSLSDLAVAVEVPIEAFSNHQSCQSQ